MSTVTIVAVAVLAAAAVVVTLGWGLRTGGWRASSELGLRFLLGAGLVGLTGQPGWGPAVVVAALVALDALLHRSALMRAIKAPHRRPAGSTRS